MKESMTPSTLRNCCSRLGKRMTFVLLLFLCLAVLSPSAFAQCSPQPVATISSSQVPSDVSPPPAGCLPINYFDDYSWRIFIALVWPAANGQRGVPGGGPVTGSGPRVFETYKSLWETFHNDGTTPSAWNNYDGTSENPCTLNNPLVNVQFGDIVLASWSHFSNFDLAGFGGLAGPLPAQNHTWIAYMAAFNETEFTQILTKQWFTRSQLPPLSAPVPFNNGSISIKSSWMDMTGNANPGRYYTRTAWLMNPTTGQCTETTVGLIGLHIVQKTPNSPQWIWSSFEQVDNVPPTVSGGPGTFNLNDGTSTQMKPPNPYPSNAPLTNASPKPFNVTRIMPIHPSTQKTNQAYQTLLKQQSASSPWQFYQLVMTQWPVPQATPSNSGLPQFTFPGTGATTAFANTSMEPFEQFNVATGCMACHNIANTKAPNNTDFQFSVKDHAFPSTAPDLVFSDSMRALRALLSSAPKPAAPARKKPVGKKLPAKTLKSGEPK